MKRFGFLALLAALALFAPASFAGDVTDYGTHRCDDEGGWKHP